MSIEFKTRYNARIPTEGTVFEEESKTLQSEYPQTTIDYYLKRYSSTGLLGDPNRANSAQFLDVSNVGDFQEMQNKVLSVRNAFMELPAEERRKYGDDPAIWVQAQIDAYSSVSNVSDDSPISGESVKEPQPDKTPADQGE